MSPRLPRLMEAHKVLPTNQPTNQPTKQASKQASNETTHQPRLCSNLTSTQPNYRCYRIVLVIGMYGVADSSGWHPGPRNAANIHPLGIHGSTFPGCAALDPAKVYMKVSDHGGQEVEGRRINPNPDPPTKVFILRHPRWMHGGSDESWSHGGSHRRAT